MHCTRRYSITSLVVMLLTNIVQSQSIQMRLEISKTEFTLGEPAILRSTVSNSSPAPASIHFGWGLFTMFVAYENEQLQDVQDVGLKIRLPVISAPTHLEFFVDRQWETTLAQNQKATRTDIVLFPKVGTYRLKAVIKDWENRPLVMSEPVKFRVLSLEEKSDAISALGDEAFLLRLGKAICETHYIEGSFSGFGATSKENTSPKYAEKVVSAIIEKYPESAFRECVMYADIISHIRPETHTQELIDGRQEMALRFEREYPRSWLLPEIYRKLFWTYVAEEDRPEAEKIRDKALALAPYATTLRAVRDLGPTSLDKIGPSIAELKQTDRQPSGFWQRSTLLMLSGGVVCVLGIVAVWLLKKKG